MSLSSWGNQDFHNGRMNVRPRADAYWVTGSWMWVMVNNTLSLVYLEVAVDEFASLKAFEKANTGSSSMTPRKFPSTSFCKVPVRANRWRKSADVPDS